MAEGHPFIPVTLASLFSVKCYQQKKNMVKQASSNMREWEKEGIGPRILKFSTAQKKITASYPADFIQYNKY
jgi:hypothetical protein